MLVTLSGIEIEVRLVQSLKASFPMLVTLLGMDMETRLVQPPKAPFPIFIMLLGMIVVLQPVTNVLVLVSMIALQLLRLS